MNKNHNPNLGEFKRLLAQYRALSFETHFLQEENALNEIETKGLHQPRVHKLTILSIEDKADEWFITRLALLQQFPKAELVWLSDSTQVIAHLETCQQTKKDLPELVLLDLYLPTLTLGLTVLKALKSHPVYCRIPTVVLSRSNHSEDITDALSHSANSYIVKPGSYQEWVEGFALLHTYCK